MSFQLDEAHGPIGWTRYRSNLGTDSPNAGMSLNRNADSQILHGNHVFTVSRHLGYTSFTFYNGRLTQVSYGTVRSGAEAT